MLLADLVAIASILASLTTVLVVLRSWKAIKTSNGNTVGELMEIARGETVKATTEPADRTESDDHYVALAERERPPPIAEGGR